MDFISPLIKLVGAGVGSFLSIKGAKENQKKLESLNAGTAARGAANSARIGGYINNLQNKKADLQSMYKQQMNTAWNQTAEGANAQRQIQQQAANSAKAAADAAIRSGGTAESVVAQAKAMQDSNANAYANMAAKGTARQDALRQESQAAMDNADSQIQNMQFKQMDVENEAANTIMQNRLKQIDQSQAAWASLSNSF